MNLNCFKTFWFCRNSRYVCNVYAQVDSPSFLPIQICTISFSLSISLCLRTNNPLVSVWVWSKILQLKRWKFKKMSRLMLFGKLWGWEWVGILEYHRNLWCIIRFSASFPAAAFSMKCCIMILSFNWDKSHWKVRIVFLNFQNIRTGNFNFAKSLRNTCNAGVYFFY